MIECARLAGNNVYKNIPNEFVFPLLRGSSNSNLRDWAVNSIRSLDNQAVGLVFKVGALRKTQEESLTICHNIAKLLRAAFLGEQPMQALSVEIDKPQDSIVFGDANLRTLLPHHDSAHGSYLTPSKLITPDFDSKMRLFSTSGVTSLHTHKLYQGFMLVEPGSGLSLTSFYDKISILKHAFTYQMGHPPKHCAELSVWCGQNVARCWNRRSDHKLRYLALGGALGLKSELMTDLSVHWADRPFTMEELGKYSELQELTNGLASKEMATSLHLFEAILDAALGMTIPKFRETFETCIVSERYDYIISQNITNLHGGLCGGKDRVVQPICLVIENRDSADYENWLAKIWQARWNNI